MERKLSTAVATLGSGNPKEEILVKTVVTMEMLRSWLAAIAKGDVKTLRKFTFAFRECCSLTVDERKSSRFSVESGE
jgi:hypothetical protein